MSIVLYCTQYFIFLECVFMLCLVLFIYIYIILFSEETMSSHSVRRDVTLSTLIQNLTSKTISTINFCIFFIRVDTMFFLSL